MIQISKGSLTHPAETPVCSVCINPVCLWCLPLLSSGHQAHLAAAAAASAEREREREQQDKEKEKEREREQREREREMRERERDRERTNEYIRGGELFRCC